MKHTDLKTKYKKKLGDVAWWLKMLFEALITTMLNPIWWNPIMKWMPGTHLYIYMHLQIFPAQHAFIYLLYLFYLCLLIFFFFFFFQKFGVPNWNRRTGPCVVVSWTAPGPGSPDNSRVQPFYWIIVLVALFFFFCQSHVFHIRLFFSRFGENLIN